MYSFHRPSDSVITVCQNNDRRSIEIYSMNRMAEDTLGYASDDVMGLPLGEFLPKKVSEAVLDYVEFGNYEHDLATVLGRVREFSVRAKDGKEIPFGLKVIRSEAEDHNFWFKLILHNEEEARNQKVFRNTLVENLKGHEILDEETGLPDRTSLQKDMELVRFHVDKGEISACFAVLKLDNFNSLIAKQGRAACIKMLRHVTSLCKQKLRFDDTIGRLDTDAVGIILMDITPEAARMVLNRLRWLVASNPFHLKAGLDLSLTVSIAFTPIAKGESEEAIIEKSEKALESLTGKTGNKIIEVANQA